MGKVRRMYTVTFNSGLEKKVLREEEENKTLIGLWIWSQKQRDEVFISVEGGVLKASSIDMVDNPVDLDYWDRESNSDSDIVQVDTPVDEPVVYKVPYEDLH